MVASISAWTVRGLTPPPPPRLPTWAAIHRRVWGMTAAAAPPAPGPPAARWSSAEARPGAVRHPPPLSQPPTGPAGSAPAAGRQIHAPLPREVCLRNFLSAASCAATSAASKACSFTTVPVPLPLLIPGWPSSHRGRATEFDGEGRANARDGAAAAATSPAHFSLDPHHRQSKHSAPHPRAR
jgi:hypothetical protein